MDERTLGAYAISEKARAERLYLHYTLALASLFAISGVALAVLALGDRLDVIVRATGSLDIRMLNAAPGFALCLAAVILFAVSRPRRARAAPADDIDLRIERAVAARLHAQQPASAGRSPQTLFGYMAETLADVLEQNAKDALPGLRKASEAKANGAASADI